MSALNLLTDWLVRSFVSYSSNRLVLRDTHATFMQILSQHACYLIPCYLLCTIEREYQYTTATYHKRSITNMLKFISHDQLILAMAPLSNAALGFQQLVAHQLPLCEQEGSASRITNTWCSVRTICVSSMVHMSCDMTRTAANFTNKFCPGLPVADLMTLF